jgi:hypothetical protein
MSFEPHSTRMKHLLTFALLATGALTLTACGGSSSDAPAESAATEAPGAGTAAAPAPGDSAATSGDHAHGSPHGGTVRTAGAGHLELVVQGSNLLVYPLDGAENPLPVRGITGAQVLVQPQSGDAVTLDLAPMGDHLMATLPAGVTAYTAIVTVPVGGEARSAQFDVGLDGHTDHGH